MKIWSKLLCSVFCFLKITLPSNVLATPLYELLDKTEDQTERETKCHKEYKLAFMTGDFDLQPVSMQAGKPINVLLLYLSDTEGRIINDAQVVTTIIDQDGNQQSSRATPYKFGYFFDINKLPVGQYRVEAELVTNAQMLTEEFMFNKT